MHERTKALLDKKEARSSLAALYIFCCEDSFESVEIWQKSKALYLKVLVPLKPIFMLRQGYISKNKA